MSKKKHNLFSGFGKQITATVSVALVLLILGIVGTLAIATGRITDNIKENLGFTLVLDDNIAENEINKLKQQFTTADYVASYSFLSREDILKQEEELVGFDIESVVGTNPYQPEFNIKVKAEYANSDSISKAVDLLEKFDGVDHAVTHIKLVDDINRNINNVSMVLLAIALALLVISFVLINNTVRLTIYSRRFLLHTMQLVGATESFIRRPILWRNMLSGLIASIIAMGLLWGIILFVKSDPQTALELAKALLPVDLLMIFGGMLITGLLICCVAAWLATNKYLRQNYDDLF